MFNRQRSGRGNAMTVIEDVQYLKPGLGSDIRTEKIGEDVERELHRQKLIV